MIFGSIIRSRESRKRNQLPVYPLDTQTTGPWSDPRGLAALSILSDILQTKIFPERDLTWPMYESNQPWPDDMTKDFQEGLIQIEGQAWSNLELTDWPPPWITSEWRIQDLKDLQLRWLQSGREKELNTSIEKYGYYAGGAPHGYASKIEEITPWEVGFFISKVKKLSYFTYGSQHERWTQLEEKGRQWTI